MNDPGDAERARRLLHLLRLEIRRLVEDLHHRRDLLVEIWGRERARAPFLDTAFHRYRSLGMGDLLLLTPEQAEAVDRFYRALDDLRLYLAHTEDMPRELALVLDRSLVELRHLGGAALELLALEPLGEQGHEEFPLGAWSWEE